MGKLFSGTIAAIFMASGLTALTTGAAQAEPEYPGVIDTTCHARKLNNPRVGNPAKVRFRVGTDGNAAADGEVTFTYRRLSNRQVEGRYRRSYNGPSRDRYKVHGLPSGKYVVRVHFNSQPVSSVYQNCNDKFRQTVRPSA